MNFIVFLYIVETQ